MMNDIIESVMMMRMDIYRQTDSQNVNSGALEKTWNYIKTIPCHAKGIITNSATTRSSDKQSFGNKYVNEELIQVRTIEKIFANQKITNITDSNGEVIWKELNYPTETPTVFEVIGVTRSEEQTSELQSH